MGKGFNAPEDPNYHGWFNEFCIVSGIKKLDDSSEKIYVERNITTNEQLGSCTKDPDCPTFNDIRCLRASCCKKEQSSAPLNSYIGFITSIKRKDFSSLVFKTKKIATGKGKGKGKLFASTIESRCDQAGRAKTEKNIKDMLQSPKPSEI